MQVKTILNQIYRLPGFVYGGIRLVPAEEEGERPHLEVEVRPRANSRAICSGCSERAPGYDRLQPRLFRFVPLLGLAVYFVYAMRRVQCARCGKVRGGARALGGRQAAVDQGPGLVSRRMGGTAVVEGDRGGLRSELGPGPPRGRDGGGVGLPRQDSVRL